LSETLPITRVMLIAMFFSLPVFGKFPGPEGVSPWGVKLNVERSEREAGSPQSLP